ncbi:hypothetical protein D9613_012623 [Agrocybe pediades]|uniref:Uncharacterized protein n=1 Tax=Agrocybe pediades TaxID=84607 RepID=A0A8H4R4F3_9AGAR|nr:hypothetical protein D9613_012623 [Agrocybe pediades]
MKEINRATGSIYSWCITDKHIFFPFAQVRLTTSLPPLLPLPPSHPLRPLSPYFGVHVLHDIDDDDDKPNDTAYFPLFLSKKITRTAKAQCSLSLLGVPVMFVQKSMVPTGNHMQFPVAMSSVQAALKLLSRNLCLGLRLCFTSDSARLIRMDFTTSGWTTPRRLPAMENLTDFSTEMLQRKTQQLLNGGGGKVRIEVRRLEDKVAKVAAKKCSVEEVSSLYKELDEWLASEKDELTSSLFLSAALLRAILMNHVAHSDASKAAKAAEANLKNKIEDLQAHNEKLDADLRSTLGVNVPETPSVPTSPTPSPAPFSSPQKEFPSSGSGPTSPLSRMSGMHTRSASMSMSARPLTTSMSTPTSPTRSHTPAPPRSHTPGVSPRSHTPGPGMSSASAAAAAMPPRSHTPGPGLSHASSIRSHTPSLRSQTPTPSSHYSSLSGSFAPPVPSIPSRYATPTPFANRSQTPAPLVPPKPRRLSTPPSPPKMMTRSTSEEKADAHERWIPAHAPDDDYIVHPSREKFGMTRSPSARPASRADLSDHAPPFPNLPSSFEGISAVLGFLSFFSIPLLLVAKALNHQTQPTMQNCVMFNQTSHRSLAAIQSHIAFPDHLCTPPFVPSLPNIERNEYLSNVRRMDQD